MTSSPRSPMCRSATDLLLHVRERRQDRRPGYDAGEPAVAVDDGHGDDLAAGKVHEVADHRVRLDGVELATDRRGEVGGAAADGCRQPVGGDDPELAVVAADHERAGGLVVTE